MFTSQLFEELLIVQDTENLELKKELSIINEKYS